MLYLKVDSSEAENTQQLIDFNNNMSHTYLCISSMTSELAFLKQNRIF